MKHSIVTLFLLLGISLAFSGEFHPYKIKSGKITYEKRKYSMKATLHKDSNGEISGSRSNPSYVEEEVTYYWDNYGDTSYEVSYQVSQFGGKPLAQRVKKYEMLWRGDHRYYYNVKTKKVSDDPYYTRKKCLKAGKLYEVEGCLAVLYPQASLLNKESVARKMVNHYKESESWDFYEWEGIKLREVSYSTKKRDGKYRRFEPDRERIAVKVDEVIKVEKSLFDPKWLKR